MQITPGIYPDLSNEDYHADQTAISSSGMQTFLSSPARFAWQRTNPHLVKRTVPMIEGGIAHTAILEPQFFADRYLVADDEYYDEKAGTWKPFDNKRGNKWKKEFMVEAEMQGKAPLLRNECDVYFEMREMVIKHPIARKILAEAKYEQSFFAMDEEHGVMIKSRPDIWCGDLIVDYKTTACDPNDTEAWAREMAKHKYYIQGFFHAKALALATGQEITGVGYIVQEKNPPYFVEFIEPDYLWHEEGKKIYDGVMTEIAKFLADGKCPVPLPGKLPLTYPAQCIIDAQGRHFNHLIGREVFPQHIGA